MYQRSKSYEYYYKIEFVYYALRISVHRPRRVSPPAEISRNSRCCLSPSLTRCTKEKLACLASKPFVRIQPVKICTATAQIM